MESKELTVVIVTFKSESKIIDCLKSIPSDIKVLIIENSNNESYKKKLEKRFSNVHCTLTGENRGYAVANNIGLNKVRTKYALILNPDTILEENAIDNFFIRAEKNNEFWLIGPANDQMVEIDFNNSDLKEVNNLKGFAIFFNLSKFNKIFFDENYFLYFEEIDLCKNVKKDSGIIYLDRSIKIFHQGASSVDKSNELELEKNRNWHWMWSTFYFHKKHRGFLQAFISILPKLLSALFKTIMFSITLNKNKRDIYFSRLSGILNSIAGNKSWYRPSLD